MSREEWARSGQGKKAENGRCGLLIEAERSDDGLRLDMPNRGRMGRDRPNDEDTTERQASRTARRGRIGERHSRAPRKLSASPADAITTPDCRIVMTPAFCGFGKTLAQKQTGISEARRTRPAHLA